jgi:hypothetical protein
MSLFLYSTNPAFIHLLMVKYNNGKHYIWCSDKYDPEGAPSSSPCEIFTTLQKECISEDAHSEHIKRYKRNIRKFVNIWLTDNKITKGIREDIFLEIKKIVGICGDLSYILLTGTY